MGGKKILVTGATGFIGAYLLHHLVQKGEREVYALKRKNSPMDLVASIQHLVQWVEGDVLDTPSLELAIDGMHQVYHCAAIVSFNGKNSQPMFKANQEGTANVVNICLTMGVQKLLHVSSIAAIGRSKDTQVISEKTKWREDEWNTPYARSKYLAEMEVWRGIAEGLNAVIVNPSNVLGSGFWEGRTSTGQFFYKIANGLPFYPKGGSGFVDVRDVALYMVRLMESDISGERFILSGENLTFKEVLFEIADVLKVKRPSIKVTPLIRELAWRAVWCISIITGKKPFITKHTARASARSFVYENDKSLAAFSFTYRPIKETITATGQQYLEAMKNGLKPKVLPF